MDAVAALRYQAGDSRRHIGKARGEIKARCPFGCTSGKENLRLDLFGRIRRHSAALVTFEIISI